MEQTPFELNKDLAISIIKYIFIIMICPMVIISSIAYGIAIDNLNDSCDTNGLIPLDIWLLVFGSVNFLFCFIVFILVLILTHIGSYEPPTFIRSIYALSIFVVALIVFHFVWIVTGAVELFVNYTGCMHPNNTNGSETLWGTTALCCVFCLMFIFSGQIMKIRLNKIQEATLPYAPLDF